MYHSITFGDKNTWDEWHLVPVSRPFFSPPPQKTKILEIPGGDGIIDLSETLTGYPIYGNRTGSFDFIIPNGFEPWVAGDIERRPWHSVYSSIMDHLHGKQMRAVLEDDPEYFYEGRFSVSEYRTARDWSGVHIDYNVGPYKWDVLASTDDWIWDRFSFVDGAIQASIFRNIEVSPEWKALKFESKLLGRAPVCPTFVVRTSSGIGVTVRFVNERLSLDMTVTLSDGRTQVPEFIFYGTDGASVEMRTNTQGTGTVSIEFRQGRL